MKSLRIWFIHADKQTYGPYTVEEVLSMLMDGTIKYSDYAFREGFSNWEFIRNIPDFDRRLINPGGDQPSVNQPVNNTPSFQKENAIEEDKWFLHDGETQQGPYSFEYIKDGLSDKTVFWTYYVWKKGMENWVELRKCADFDRRKLSRDESVPSNLTTDLNDLEKQAIKHEEAMLLDGDDKDFVLEKDRTYEYQNEIEGKIELIDSNLGRGKYPIRAIFGLLIVALFFLGAVSLYPKFVQFLRELDAKKLYVKAISQIEVKNYEEGFDSLFSIMDLYPETNTKRKVQNYLSSKEQLTKSSIADETKRIRTLMTLYVEKYGVLPANAVDISYVPDFWLKYFGEAYFKWDTAKKIYVMVYGIKRPVENYLYGINGKGEETESELKISDFQSKKQDYIKLEYTGTASQVQPIINEIKAPTPQKVEATKLKTKDVFSEEPKIQTPEPKESEEAVDEEPEEDVELEKQEPEEVQEEKEIVPDKPQGDEYGDLIDTIKKDGR